MKKSTKGFTLIEILLYVAITAIIFGGIMAFVDVIFKNKINQQIVSEVEGGGNTVMEVMSQHIRNAKSITTPAASSTSPSLKLVMKDASISPVIFDLSGGAIRISEAGISTTSLSSSLATAKNIFFSNLSRINTPGAVRFGFTLEYANPSANPNYNYSRRFIGAGSLRPN